MIHDELTEKIIASAYLVYNEIGFGYLESVYERSMLVELRAAGLRAEAQYPLSVSYKGHVVGKHLVDLMVEERIVVELKSVNSFAKLHEVQLVSYLTTCGCDTGLLINFGETGVQVKRKVRDLNTLRNERIDREKISKR